MDEDQDLSSTMSPEATQGETSSNQRGDPAVQVLEALSSRGFDAVVQASKGRIREKMVEHAKNSEVVSGSDTQIDGDDTFLEHAKNSEDVSGSGTQIDEDDTFPEPPPELNMTLKIIAVKGILPYPWHLIRTGICLKIVSVCLQSLVERGWEPKQENNNTFGDRVDHILTLLANFSDAPFTVQRLAEVLLDGSNQYRMTHKLLNAIEKQLSVEMTLDQVDDGTGECVLVQHADEYFPERFHYGKGDEVEEVTGDEKEEGMGTEGAKHPCRDNEALDKGENDENEVNEEDKGFLKRKSGVSKANADLSTSKRSRLQSHEIEQPEAFASSYAT